MIDFTFKSLFQLSREREGLPEIRRYIPPPSPSPWPTNLALHNVCSYPVWPLITPNGGFPSISNNTFQFDAGGRGQASFTFPDSFWAGHVVLRTACYDAVPSLCETGTTPPFTVAQLIVHAESVDLATYSVSLLDGFKVPMVIRPQSGRGQCPVFGCTVDLNRDCQPEKCALNPDGDVVACKGWATYFKDRCPFTRATLHDKEPVPQRCFAPGELKIAFCPPAMVGDEGESEPELIRTVVADN